jgi:hypothetical protein
MPVPATTTTSAFVRTAPASVHPMVQSVTVSVQLKSPTACPPSLSHEEPSDRGRTHLQEKPPRLLIYMEMSMRLFGSPEEQHVSCSTPLPHRNHPALLTSWSSLLSNMPVP